MDQPEEIATAAKKILVIDDDPMMRDLLVEFLQVDGHCLFTAANGAEGLTKARALQPDLILLDVSMPAPNGLEVCTELKRTAATAKAPVLFISAWLSTHDIDQMMTAGGAGFLAKPFSFLEMRQAVGRLLRL